jgi:hypothetical protein
VGAEASGQSAVIAAALFLAAAATITLPDARGRAAGGH